MNRINLKNPKHKNIYPLGENFIGKNPTGETIDFTNYYFRKNEKPMFGISGEFHFSRCEDSEWNDELSKMKQCGINIVSTYIFWNHHEETEGVFCFEGRRNVRRFIELCQKNDMLVIIRVGPFNHGEARNGGLPDWLYGKPFEVREMNDGFLNCTRMLYAKIAQQLKGLYYKDGGPIIGAQIENEYQHSSAPWEMTTGVANEWIRAGHSGDAYMYKLRDIAKEVGIDVPFYTCTAWGGAVAPSEMMPLWGGYSYRPWIYNSYSGPHPATDEYVYSDFHNNEMKECREFKPDYNPEDKPYACCEMGGGMQCSYNYRFQFAYKSVDAMANIKLASGCNFLGYYVFKGGTNPKGNSPEFLNEGQVPKLSYDYQAAIGEFGQLRESYKRLKPLHFFSIEFSDQLCDTITYLPQGATQIDPTDLDTLRFAVRMKENKGFLFINNFQDHVITRDKNNEMVTLELEKETIEVGPISLAADENCILPFNMDLGGINLKYALAQPVTRWKEDGIEHFLFMVPEGMNEKFVFEKEVHVEEENQQFGKVYKVSSGTHRCVINTLSRQQMNNCYQLDRNGKKIFIITEASVLEGNGELRLETTEEKTTIYVYPTNIIKESDSVIKKNQLNEKWDEFQVLSKKKSVPVSINQTGSTRYTIQIPENVMDGVKEAILQITYDGDIGQAFIDGDMIHDNFCNGAVWEIGLKKYADRLKDTPLTIYIVPLKKGAKVNVESAMAARKEEVDEITGQLYLAEIMLVYEVKIPFVSAKILEDKKI